MGKQSRFFRLLSVKKKGQGRQTDRTKTDNVDGIIIVVNVLSIDLIQLFQYGKI